MSLLRGGLRARMLGPRDRRAATLRAALDPLANLFLLDVAAGLGLPPAPGEAPSEMVGAFRRGALVALAALRPCVVLEPELDPEVLHAILPHFAALESGLLKSPVAPASALWRELAARGRRAIVDRIEHSNVLRPSGFAPAPVPDGARIRPAAEGDLEALVAAARASLREEGRPDPFEGDPDGFRRWVRGRVSRASVAELDGSVVFVGYADVRRAEGWLIQGVYTFPPARRRGIARAGVSALCRQAFAAGADHVQLAVVDGNHAAERLYAGLGFRRFAELRTILFEAPPVPDART